MNKLLELDQQQVFVDDPIYTKYSLEGASEEFFREYMRDGSVDVYCPNCEAKSVFQIENSNINDFLTKNSLFEVYGLVTVKGLCTRRKLDGMNNTCEQTFYAIFKRDLEYIIKIGQHPSKADCDFGELDDVFKELPKPLRSELGTAIGLHSHGVGIGAFVYLRRIFERLIQEAKALAVNTNGFDEAMYNKAKMSEKIQLLNEYLPKRLVKSSHLYGFLSKGIHELDEKECKEKFALVKQDGFVKT